MKTNIHFLSYLPHFFLEWEMFQINVVEKIKTHILCSVTFFRISCRLWDNVEKCCRVGQTTNDNMAHAHSVLDTQGYKHTHTHTLIVFPLQQWLHESTSLLRCRLQLKCDDTRWRTGREVKGKLANAVCSQYPSHYLGTWCIQHYYRWCAHLGCQ